MQISKMKATRDVRRSRRLRTRLTRVLALAVAGPLITGSLAYAAGVGPVRRNVDEFLKGTARLFDKAGSSTRDFHLSPNPSGQGVLMMPMDDRGPRPDSGNSPEDNSGKANKEKSSSGSRGPKEKIAPTTAAESKKHRSDSGSGESNKEKPQTSAHDSKASDSGSGSVDGGEESSDQGWSDSDDDSGEGSSDSDQDHSGSHSGSGHSGEDDSGSSSGESGSGSEND